MRVRSCCSTSACSPARDDRRDVPAGSAPGHRGPRHSVDIREIVPDVTVRTCSAEDLIIYKLVAARPRDLLDMEGVVRRQRRKLDVDRIRRWGRAFAELKEDPDLLRPFEDAWRQLPAG